MSALVILAGSFLVLLYTWHRFSQPSANRSSTTAIRYYLAAAFYCLWGLFIYATLVILLSASPEAAVRLLETSIPGDFKPFAIALPLPILVALLLTVLLPKVPTIAHADGWVREQIEYMASIPHEVRRLTAELERSDSPGSGVTLAMNATAQERVRQQLQALDFAPGHIRFSGGRDLAARWTKASGLVLALTEWRADAKLVGVCDTCAASMTEVIQLHEELVPRVRRCLRALGAVDGGPGNSEARGILSEYAGEVERQVKALLSKVYRVVAAATLRAELTHRDRMARLSKLGFRFDQGIDSTPIPVAHRLAALYAALAAGFLIVQLAARAVGLGSWRGYPFTLALSVLVPLTYGVAVLWAIFLKRSWGGVTRPPGEARPFLAYLLSGLLAAASNLPIALGLAFLSPSSPGSMPDALTKSLVWVLLSFATAATTAFLIDDRPRALPRRWGGRWSEGAVQGAVTVAVALLVGRILIETGLHPTLRLGQLVPVAGAIGFTVGAFVPTWYRSPLARRARPAGDGGRRRRRGRRPRRLVVADRSPARAAA
jgi:hypothetical protein